MPLCRQLFTKYHIAVAPPMTHPTRAVFRHLKLSIMWTNIARATPGLYGSPMGRADSLTFPQTKPVSGVLLTVGWVLCGCNQPTALIAGMEDPRLRDKQLETVLALRKYGDRPDVQRCIIQALDNKLPIVRYFAAEILDEVCCYDPDLREAAIEKLVEHLDDRSFGEGCVHRYGAFVYMGTPSVRARVFLTLVGLTQHDFGLDQQAWRRYLDGQRGVPGTTSRSSIVPH